MATVSDYLSPSSAIKAAGSAHPAFKYATATLGLMGIVVVVQRWGVSAPSLVFGSIILVVLMVLFLVFAQAASLSRSTLNAPAQLLVWTFLLVTVASAGLLFTSAFFDAPLPMRSYLVSSLLPMPAGPGGLPPLKLGPIPPGRLLSASPFRARLDDCVNSACDVDLYLRGYDSRGRLRYDGRDHLGRWTNGEFRDTNYNSAERLYFEATEKVVFQLYCRLGSGPVLAGQSAELDWQPRNETGTPGYFYWLSCGNSDFKVSTGVSVQIASVRLNEPAVKPDVGPPLP